MLKDLIEALEIFNKYIPNEQWPTHCEHDVLQVQVREEHKMSTKDIERVTALGFHYDDDPDRDCWCSYRFGSA
jgi:hypothetical protein